MVSENDFLFMTLDYVNNFFANLEFRTIFFIKLGQI